MIRALRRPQSAKPQPRICTAFYYDGDCGMCLGFVRRMRRFDSWNRVSWVAFQSLDRPPAGVSLEAMRRAAHLIAAGGEIRVGYDAIAALLLLLPRLSAVGLLMRLPGAGLVGRPVYAVVARNRHRISSCAL